jgi:transcriptional regulator with XRE-family HTH domain
MSTEGIAHRIKEMRRVRGLTQQQLARRSDLTVGGVRQIEQVLRRDLHLSTMSGIAKGLGVSVAALIGEETLPEIGEG